MNEEQKKRKELEKLIEKSESEHQIPEAKAELIHTLQTTPIKTHEYIGERIRIVALDLMNGYSPYQIWKRYPEWEISYTHIRQSYVLEARKFIAENVLTEEIDIRVDLLAKYNYLFQLNMLNRDYKEARSVLDSITKLTQTITSTVTVLGNIQTINLVEVLKEQLDEEENAD